MFAMLCIFQFITYIDLFDLFYKENTEFGTEGDLLNVIRWIPDL